MNEELKFKGSVAFKSFLTGMGFGALLMFILLSAQKVSAFDENGEAVCLAKNIYFEAGNQPLAGKVAVEHVVFNRMEHSYYPQDICGVVYQARWRENWKGEQVPIRHQCQFSWFCDGKSDDIPIGSENWVKAQMISWEMMTDSKFRGITEGSTHYHATFVNPSWNKMKNLDLVGRIGLHIFYRWN